jgi:hypothetical protein
MDIKMRIDSREQTKRKYLSQLERGRFFFARGQNFPLQLATVEVAGPHKNT